MADEKKTLFRHAVDAVLGEAEAPPDPAEDPLGAPAGSLVVVDSTAWVAAGLSGKPLQVAEVVQVSRSLTGEKTDGMVDYVLDDGAAVLRAVETRRGGQLGHVLFALLPYYEQGWDPDDSPGLLADLDHLSGEFYRYRDEPNEEHWHRDAPGAPAYDCEVGPVKAPETLWVFNRFDGAAADRLALFAHLSGRYDPATGKVAGGDKVVTMRTGPVVLKSKITVLPKRKT